MCVVSTHARIFVRTYVFMPVRTYTGSGCVGLTARRLYSGSGGGRGDYEKNILPRGTPRKYICRQICDGLTCVTPAAGDPGDVCGLGRPVSRRDAMFVFRLQWSVPTV